MDHDTDDCESAVDMSFDTVKLFIAKTLMKTYSKKKINSFLKLKKNN